VAVEHVEVDEVAEDQALVDLLQLLDQNADAVGVAGGVDVFEDAFAGVDV
jgi:hypothetical protein